MNALGLVLESLFHLPAVVAFFAFLAVVATAYAAVVIAELGDRTFFLAAILAGNKKWNRWAVFIGAGLAFLVTMGVASGAAFLMSLAPIPDSVRLWIVLGLFVGGAVWFAVAALRWKQENDETKPPAKTFVRQIFVSALMLGLVEFGDKSQVAAFGIAGATGEFVPVLIGAWLAMMTVVGLGLCVGSFVGKLLSPKKMLWLGAGVFCLFGLFTIWQLINL